jgi:hypothetical protein
VGTPGAIEIGLGEIGQVEPDCDRQAGQQQHHQQEKDQPGLAAKGFLHCRVP